jgi:uncharacterized membrane protein
MAIFLFILKFFGGIILLFAVGSLIGHLLKLDKYYEDMQKHKNEEIQKYNNEDDQNYNN